MIAHTSLLWRRKDCIHMRKMNASHTPAQNRCWYQKLFQNSIKSAGYTGGRRKLPIKYAENHPWPWFCKSISRKLRDSPFLSASMIQREIQWWHSKLPAQKAKYSDQCTYDNIDSFMNIVIDMHNFRIYDAKEYIRTSFPEISYPQHRGLSLRYCLYSSRKGNSTSLSLSVMSSQSQRKK